MTGVEWTRTQTLPRMKEEAMRLGGYPREWCSAEGYDRRRWLVSARGIRANQNTEYRRLVRDIGAIEFRLKQEGRTRKTLIQFRDELDRQRRERALLESVNATLERQARELRQRIYALEHVIPQVELLEREDSK